jgi:hypothetical protein
LEFPSYIWTSLKSSRFSPAHKYNRDDNEKPKTDLTMRSVYALNFTLPNNNKFAYRTDRFACIFSYGPSGMIGLHASHAVGTTCVLGTKRVNPKNHHKIQKHTTTLKLSQFQKYYQPLSLWRKKFDFQFSTTIEVWFSIHNCKTW